MPTLIHRPLALLALLMSGCLIAACGRPGAGSSGSPTASGGSAVPGCPNFVTVVQTSPEPTDYSEGGPVAKEQQRLEPDAQAATAYGAAHPQDFGSVRLVNGPRVRIVIAFRNNVAEHCAALRALLTYPDEFEIVQSRYTDAELRVIQEAITRSAAGKIYSVGVSGDVVEVALRADAAAIADDLLARYGDQVRVTVGRFTYPDRASDPSVPACVADGPEAALPGIRATVRLSSDQVAAGADFTGSVTLVNDGPAVAHIETGSPLTAVVYSSDGRRVVSTYYGGIAGVGLGLDLAPGASQAIDILGSTASCDPAIGYTLVPGTYVVRVPVEVYTMHDTGPTEIAYLWSAPIELTVVASR